MKDGLLPGFRDVTRHPYNNRRVLKFDCNSYKSSFI